MTGQWGEITRSNYPIQTMTSVNLLRPAGSGWTFDYDKTRPFEVSGRHALLPVEVRAR